MDYRETTLQELSAKASRVTEKSALVGFDGFVDKIVKPVGKRWGQGKNFEPIPTITDFAKRIGAAAGESANIELFEELEKLGGNGPIMANALRSIGCQVRYIGAVGNPYHRVFEEFGNATQAVSLCDPALTYATEFHDGKIMFGSMQSLDQITFDRIVKVMGEGAFFDVINRADLLAMVNWTMIPNMTAILESILDRVLPNLGPKELGRTFFFDLADPAKRSDGDLRTVINTISRYRSHGRAILGLNHAEAKQVAEVLELGHDDGSPEGLKSLAQRIRTETNLSAVVVHPRDGAACATKEDAWHVQGPFCENPLISTGAGDHFNAGFVTGLTLGLSVEASLTVAVSTSGYYVRTAESPSLSDISGFIHRWKSGDLK